MIKHVHFVRKLLADGTPRWYVYAWRGGPQVMVADGKRRPALTSEAVRLIAEATKPARKEVAPGDTLGHLIQRWQASSVWASYSANTKKTWSTYAGKVAAKWGSVPLAVFNDPRMKAKIVDWQEENRDRPRAADLGVDVLERILAHGVSRGELSINAAAGIASIYKGGGREEIVWTEAELVAFEQTAARIGRQAAASALRFCSVTGLRRQDLVTVTWEQVKQFAIVKKALKSSRKKRRFATVPRVPELDALLEKLAKVPRGVGVETVLVNGEGQPWQEDALTKDIALVRKAMGGVYHVDEERQVRRSKHLHDARGTYATKLMEVGLADEEIADVMGWSPEQVARIRAVYVDRTAYHVALGRKIAGRL